MKDKSDEPEFVESSFAIHTFSDEIHDRKVLFQVVKMVDSCFIFINNQDDLQLVDLSLALQSRFGPESLSTSLIGYSSDNTSINFTKRLNKKLKKTLYVSLNVEGDRLLLPAVEKRLYEEIKSNADKF